MARGYVGWALPEKARAKLLDMFEPAYPDVIAHHVTLKHGVPDTVELPTATEGVIVGLADDGEAVQALVVMIDVTTDRPGGGTYHITWSIDRSKGATPYDSNRVIKECGWEDAAPRVVIPLEPKFFESGDQPKI